MVVLNRSAALAGVLALAAIAAPAEAAPPQVTATGAYCRATPAGGKVGACYVTLKASGDDALVGVSTPAAGRGEVHDMTTDGGVMRMRKLERLPLAAGAAVTLAPGGKHLMLMQLKAPLRVGTSVTLVLTFERSAPLRLQAPVRELSAAAGH